MPAQVTVYQDDAGRIYAISQDGVFVDYTVRSSVDLVNCSSCGELAEFEDECPNCGKAMEE